MAKTKKTEQKTTYKANPRFFEWVPADSPDFADIYANLKKGDACSVNVSPARLQWCLDNELLASSK